MFGLLSTAAAVLTAQPRDAATGIDPATGWLLAPPDTMAVTGSDTVRVSEGYRFNDPLAAEALDAETRTRALEDSLPAPHDASNAGTARYADSAWVSGLRVGLLGDRDGDGYYRGFRLDIDVDTSARSADVYAVIYLQRSGFGLQALHTTRNFRVEGTRRSDEYTVEIELLDDYRTGRYDLAIDIVDAYHGLLLDAVSASEFSNLGGLPLEAPDDGFYQDGFGDDCLIDDHDFDGYAHCSYGGGFYDDYPQNDGTVGVAYAGSAGAGLLLALLLPLSRNISAGVRREVFRILFRRPRPHRIL